MYWMLKQIFEELFLEQKCHHKKNSYEAPLIASILIEKLEWQLFFIYKQYISAKRNKFENANYEIMVWNNSQNRYDAFYFC